MKREIKFRSWIPSYNEMRYMPEPSFLYKDKISYNIARFFNTLDAEDCGHYIMQYTGLKDLNGKEIYEGDILSYKSSHTKHEGKVFNNVVEFTTGQSLCGWRMRNRSCIVKATPYKFVSSEIIGNIYENPELLETKKAQLSETNVEK